jgi:hypothetical protein
MGKAREMADLQSFTSSTKSLHDAALLGTNTKKFESGVIYSAISRLSAKGHCSSIHCTSQRKPAMRAM